jgi:outer membrane lipoprotein-sorting protein
MLNRFLRTAPTRTLLGTIAGFVLVIAGGTAIALAAQGSGPVPKHKRLAVAVHDAMAAPQIQGISADISFTNGLIDTSEIQGSDPLLQGGSGHVWISNTGQFRLELYGDNGDPELVVNRSTWWISDPTLRTVYEGTLPADSAQKPQDKSQNGKLPSVAQIQADINRLAQHLLISGAAPTDVGGQPTYTVTVSPKQAGGLIGKLQLAWDSLKGVPLRFAVYARGNPKPALELAATNVSYQPITGVFDLKPPSGYRVVTVATPAASAASHTDRHGKHAEVTGVKAVAKHLSFKLAAPAMIAGMQRQSVSLMGKGALVTYGQGLGGIAVIEEPASASSARQLQLSQGNGDHQNGISLPTFSVHGASAQELDTALGTFARFTSGGVTYTVIGSVPPHTARAAARGL